MFDVRQKQMRNGVMSEEFQDFGLKKVFDVIRFGLAEFFALHKNNRLTKRGNELRLSKKSPGLDFPGDLDELLINTSQPL